MTRFARRAVDVAGIEKSEARAAAATAAAAAAATPSTVHRVGVAGTEEGQCGEEAGSTAGDIPAGLEGGRVEVVATRSEAF